MSEGEVAEGGAKPPAEREGATEVYICRHGTSEWNKLGKWQGQQDPPLAPEGTEQAKAQAEAFVASGVRFAACWCSDLQRAATTAALLAAPHRLTPAPDPRLRECHLGEFEGLHKTEIYGPKYAALFSRLSQLSHNERMAAPYFKGLEAPRDISARVVRCVEAAAAQAPGQVVLMVTHSTVMEAVLACEFGRFFEGISMRNLAWMRCRWAPDGMGLEIIESDGIKCEESFIAGK